jgi:hypothetical protein
LLALRCTDPGLFRRWSHAEAILEHSIKRQGPGPDGQFIEPALIPGAEAHDAQVIASMAVEAILEFKVASRKANRLCQIPQVMKDRSPNVGFGKGLEWGFLREVEQFSRPQQTK